MGEVKARGQERGGGIGRVMNGEGNEGRTQERKGVGRRGERE